MEREQLRKYAELGVKVGINLQPGQPLVIGYGDRQVFPEHVAFAQVLTEVAYEAGASFVQIDWGDEHWKRQTVAHGSLDLYEERLKWQLEWVERMAKEGAGFLAIPAADPTLFEGIDNERVTRATRAKDAIFRDFTDRRTNDLYSWTLMSMPTQAWANKVFPELPEGERVEALWKDILFCTRANNDNPVAAWQAHLKDLQNRADWLNRLQIDTLHYTAPGTDLYVKMAHNHYWKSGASETAAGVPFVANMPTEEVFSAPDRLGVSGTVSSTMPLNHNGTLIEGIQLRFEQGRIVEAHAARGEEGLRRIVEADEGSHYLGEVALVPVDSPISKNGRLFFNTLFDENASCHLAIGKAYSLIEGGRDLPFEEWEAHGLNRSMMHVDFMIGSAELDIDATTLSGATVPIMRKGRWTAEV
ncbi:aminopeptidase [Alicyclobacillus sp. ALC3]|uniref:aminopeptidase n=1 Tax=Alicyclobacillus sp. ALC3 TaxID=2796143 RepID=UPI00237943A4|nr:aminopeptidase [Alicyclobacillus sp. ALC3]WDL95555.1 aminopeptidase [Alicyclobacillus sp. ALC3]